MDKERERKTRRQGDKETRRQEEKHLFSLSPRLLVSLSPRPLVPLSPCLCSMSPSPRVTRFDLEGKLRPELKDAWRERRGEAAEFVWLVLQFASEANTTLFPQLIEAERAVGDIVHFLEVGPIEEIERVEHEFERERLVGPEAQSPSYSQIGGEDPRPDAGVASYLFF